MHSYSEKECSKVFVLHETGSFTPTPWSNFSTKNANLVQRDRVRGRKLTFRSAITVSTYSYTFFIARAEILIYNGQVDEGLPLALRAADISQRQGHRRLERIYSMRRFLSRKAIEYAKAEEELGDVLDGPVVQWDKIG